MKEYYCVTSLFYDSGRTAAAITDIVQAEKKPENSYKSTRTKDIYIDWYASRWQAEVAVQAALNA